MAAPQGNQFAKGNNGGSPGYGKLNIIKEKVGQHTEKWWTEWEKMMNDENTDLKKFAMSEFNKLQTKMIPQDVEMGGEMLLRIAKEVADKHEYDSNANTNNGS